MRQEVIRSAMRTLRDPGPMDASLKRILDSLTTLEFEEFGGLTLTSVTWEENGLIVNLSVCSQLQAARAWRLRCQNVRRSQIVNDQGISTLRIEHTHALLLPYTDATV